MLEVNNLTKSFGNTIAVDNLSFTIKKGQVLGLLGHNGAGKSTTIKMALNILRPDNGNVLWNGTPFKRADVSVGYLPEARGLYEKCKVDEQLIYFGKLEGMQSKSIRENLTYWLERFEIPEYKSKMLGELSKGNQQKIQIIAAILHDPDFLILDEPFSGLDPINANIFSSVINELMQKQKTIIMSSHRMEQIETFCEEILILKKGRALLQGNLNKIKADEGISIVEIRTENSIKKWLTDHNYDFQTQNLIHRIAIKNEEEAFLLFKELSQLGVGVRHFVMREKTLNELFVEKVNS